jgi:glycosyltransferase involved in cell wall biosynthesis
VVATNPPTTAVVAFCGTRGLPARYGGFETAVDEISRRFVERGHDCEIFCRLSSGDRVQERSEDRRLVYVRGSSRRSLETFVSAIQTGLHLLRHRRRYVHVFWFNNANLPGILLTRLARIPFSVNLDGLEWRRAKWSLPYKAYYFLSSFLISRLGGTLISDSLAIGSYYRETFSRETEFIPYGVPPQRTIAPESEREILDHYGVTPGGYFLQITRFEPDNLPLATAEAFRKTGLEKDDFQLLLVGYQHDTPYATKTRRLSGRNGVRVLDAVYDAEVLQVLRRNCFCYVHGNSVGGTNPALLEAMADCPRVLAIEGPFSREVLGETGVFFAPEGLYAALRAVVSLPDRSEAMRERARSRYQWDAVGEAYVRLAEEKPAAYSPSGT